ncbi:hypothetical protein [Shouchella lonarensis]|uniref:Uncharacterized protein n=1 Tax=Shouchella lonarensis TaxID=1464122 RepID=A0A1G6M7X4_9BACI|nr:hypothetical protein [Shouchella lonarensis]SDC51086.1 hypothetical protein SAMN05421737_109106 [Shouchella lonarensis]
MTTAAYETPVVDLHSYEVTEDFAWFSVFVVVLIALGATILLGAGIWCLVNGNGSFTGGLEWEGGLRVALECK